MRTVWGRFVANNSWPGQPWLIRVFKLTTTLRTPAFQTFTRTKREREYQGLMRKSGSFKFRATKIGKDTALAQIVKMVQDAMGSKAPIARLVDVVASYFVPTVMIAAILTFLVWFDFGPSPALAFAVVTAVTVLIIACPCAVGMAVPMSLVAGVGKGAEHGVLIRNGEALQTASQLSILVLDKTGTITEASPN